jgi:hypothetical protein
MVDVGIGERRMAGLTASGDQIFILIGAGHVPIVRKLLELSSQRRVVYPELYLR